MVSGLKEGLIIRIREIQRRDSKRERERERKKEIQRGTATANSRFFIHSAGREEKNQMQFVRWKLAIVFRRIVLFKV